ncbi:MAG: glycoside hydrolase family 3, partial [Flavobacteriaceae bacterium]
MKISMISNVRNSILILVLFIFNSTKSFSQDFKYPFQDSTLSVETRIQDLLKRMTLEEKVRQMDMYKGEFFKDEENFSPSKAKAKIGNLGVGAIHDIYPRSAKMINDLQKFVIDNNRWGIPAL